MRAAGHDATIVNLDPGLEDSDFEPDVDVREWVRLADIQDEYGLGPNGAQVAAADMIALKIFDIKQAIEELKTDYVLIDTPGQIELFAFREASKAIVDALSGDRSTIAFLFDPALARNAGGFVSLRMLSATVEFRFRLPMLNVLGKADVLSPAQLEEVLGWAEDRERLYEAVTRDTPTPDVRALHGAVPRDREHGPAGGARPDVRQGGDRDGRLLPVVPARLRGRRGPGAVPRPVERVSPTLR